MTDSNQQSGLSKEQIDSVITLFSNGELDEALHYANKLIKSFSENSILHNVIGACYASKGELGSAVNSYKKATELEPNYAKAHFNLGNALHELTLQGLSFLQLLCIQNLRYQILIRMVHLVYEELFLDILRE